MVLKISVTLNLILLAVVVFLCLENRKFKAEAEYVDFEYKPPTFSDQENLILKKIYPALVESIALPFKYYVSSVSIKSDGIHVYMQLLSDLQTGVSQKTGRGRLSLDGGLELLFDQSYKIIRIKPDA